MNITAQLDQLSTAEKISTMEYLWDDLCRHADKVASPDWHGEVLAQRERSVVKGEVTYQDWAAEKVRIRDALK